MHKHNARQRESWGARQKNGKGLFAFYFQRKTGRRGKIPSTGSQRGTRVSSGGPSGAKGDCPAHSQSKHPQGSLKLKLQGGRQEPPGASSGRAPRQARLWGAPKAGKAAQRAPAATATISGHPDPRGAAAARLNSYWGWGLGGRARPTTPAPGNLPPVPLAPRRWAPPAQPAGNPPRGGTPAPHTHPPPHSPSPRRPARAPSGGGTAGERVTARGTWRTRVGLRRRPRAATRPRRPLGEPSRRSAPQLPGERCLLALLGPRYFFRLIEDEEETYRAHSPPLPDWTHVFCETRSPSPFSFVCQGCAENNSTRGTNCQKHSKKKIK